MQNKRSSPYPMSGLWGLIGAHGSIRSVCSTKTGAGWGNGSWTMMKPVWLGWGTGCGPVPSGEPQRVAVAIEVPRGAIVEGLLDRGFHLFAINPKQLDRFRDRHSAAGAKDDRRDAFVLADSVRTDQPSFRRVHLGEPQLLLLRELSRAEETLLAEFRRSANRLREQLHRFYPQMLQLCAAADEPWLWDLITLAPTPAHAILLSEEQVQPDLKAARFRHHKARP